MIEGETRMAALREKLVRLDPYCINNMDEAALFYQLACTRYHVLALDARETRVMGLQSEKARITLIVCVTSTGRFKSIAFIGKASAPV